MVGTPPSVLHVVLSLDLGGLERLVLALAAGQRATGQKVRILCINEDGTLATAARASGIDVTPLGAGGAGRNAAYRRLKDFMADAPPAVIHTHQIGATKLLGPIARVAGIPLVHTEHGNAFARTRSPFRKARLWAIYRTSLPDVAFVCCVSEEIRRTFLRLRLATSRRVGVFPNGTPDLRASPESANIRTELGWARTTPVVGTVARLDRVKRLDILLRAAAVARLSIPDMQILVVGDGPERERLMHLANELGLASAVHFVGYAPDPADYLRAMDVFALTSESEGQPMSVLEAWSMSVPVMATSVGALPDLIEDRINGILVPPLDIASTASSMVTLLEDRELARELGASGRQRFERTYSIDQTVHRYNSLYLACLSPGGWV